MYEIKGFSPRVYQQNILETCKENNTLVILPTGLGKTSIAILLAIYQLNKNPNSKVLITAPTKPLASQLCNEFKSKSNIEKITLLTGSTAPNKRAEIWNDSVIIAATPQTIQKDIENNRINLDSVSLFIVDECHRSRMHYASTIISNNFKNKVLALTASPGNTKEKIDEICKNLNIQKIEIRTEDDDDVKQYIQKKEISHILVDLPQELVELQNLLKEVKNEKLLDLKKTGFSKPLYLVNKRDLILLQSKFRAQISKKNYMAFYGISLVSQILKIDHAIELLETQGLNQLNEYFNKIKTETTKAAKNILNNKKIQKVFEKLELLSKNSFKHPKIDKLKEIISEEVKKDPNTKIIVFANFRNSVSEIVNELKSLENVRPIFLLGQKEGITQKHQIETIKRFEDNTYNILIGTCIIEEGLDVRDGAKLAIFYDAVPSEIRNIQRRGRVGRLKAGKIIFLMTKNSRDVAYFYTAKRKEGKMKNIVNKLKTEKDKQLTLG